MEPSRFFFIDSENVANRWLPLLDESDSRFCVFYTDRSPSISYATLPRLLESSDKIELVHCVTGHNGLDFQLSTYLGYMLHDIASSEVIIVSNDTGFDAVVSFWAKKGMNIRRQSIDPQLY
ncbi:PIN domain-containing protein [Bifidobacterium adolescentis]|nr:PIN domain-containing protein [Bifidobacterium adolescentis]